MLIEETAANVDENQTTSPVDNTELTETQAFAKRLKEEKAKVKQETLEELATSFGYTSYSEYLKAQTDNNLIDKGFDPDKVRPIVEELIKKDPAYIKAMEKAREYENLEKEMFAKTSIESLNAKFGTDYKSINDLDKETVDMWNNGMTLEKAFAANNYEKLQELTLKKVKNTSKDHLREVNNGSVISTAPRTLSEDEMRMFKIINPGATDAQIKAFLNSTK